MQLKVKVDYIIIQERAHLMLQYERLDELYPELLYNYTFTFSYIEALDEVSPEL
jgi:hypothetical protein